MKKLLPVFIPAFLFTTANAQVKIGVKGGWSYTGTVAKYKEVKQSVSYLSGYGIGAMAKIPFDGVLHFSPSVMINKRGFAINHPAGGSNKKEEYSMTYLDLMPALSTEFIKGNNAFSIGAGPVFGFTNFGKLKITDSTGNTGTQNLKFGYGAYGWFDLGLNASLGCRFNKIALEVSYYTGLANINNKEESDGRNMQHRVCSITLGYYFKETAH
ncbi:MAG: porin family protein [Ferruginibacter sp.]